MAFLYGTCIMNVVHWNSLSHFSEQRPVLSPSPGIVSCRRRRFRFRTIPIQEGANGGIVLMTWLTLCENELLEIQNQIPASKVRISKVVVDPGEEQSAGGRKKEPESESAETLANKVGAAAMIDRHRSLACY